MANYLFVFRNDIAGTGLSEEERSSHFQKWGTWIDALREAGTYLAGDPLAGGGKVLSGKKMRLTDGPYTETKEIIGGYLLIEAGSEDEAVEVARGCPIYETGGSVEVRQIQAM